ncbi:NADH-quinone oxidoreductase subunit NuoE [Consotaella aegiceratis]|uniref:NADH-quinone oxidoreductase subunit NuoE n=1 Tax=Consotaella aegiceratis TaxID=3097961 RepID=UPI002F4257A0
MSVRRLAEDRVQPDHFAFSEDNARWAEQTIRRYPEGRQHSAVIPLLMRAQEQEGWVTKAAIESVADMLHMPLIRVLEVATFYTQFQLKPVGTRAHIQVCGTTPCMLRGADELKAVCRKKIHEEQFHLSEDGTLSWEEVECLGACVNAPMVMIFKDTYEDLTPERLEEIIDLFEKGEGGSVPVGPQIDRHLSAPVGGATTLTSLDGKAPRDGGPAGRSAPPQGAGAGESGAPSKAARPDTHAVETDPSVKGPDGKAAAPEADQQRVDDKASVDPAAGAEKVTSGQSSGSRQGETDADAKETDEEKAALGHQSPSSTGRGLKELAAEDATVPPVSQVSAPKAPDAGSTVERADLSGTDQSGVHVVEGQRADTSDTRSGPPPAAGDTFETASDDRADGVSEDSGLERTAPGPIGERPSTLLDAPRGEKDDLQQIKGVGKVLEDRLNELGVFHFWQIAGWSDEELVWIDDHLNFRGRAIRDRWIDQAKELSGSSGGAA